MSVTAQSMHRDSGLWSKDNAPGADTVTASDPNAAFNTFFAAEEQKAFRIARYAIWDDELAMDIVQDAMLKLVEKYSQRPSKEWPALFYTILNNRVRDMQRQRIVRDGLAKFVSLFQPKRGHDDDGEVDLLEAGAATEAGARNLGPEDQLGNKQLADAIDAAVAKLSWRQRQVFLLREAQGLAVRETAEILGCSEGTVKQHHFRAMQALREKLKEVWKND